MKFTTWGNEQWKPPALPAWARMWGFDCAEWVELGQALPTDDRWPRAEDPPQIGHHRTIHVFRGFRAVAGHPVWVLFRPGLSARNGWEEYPDEIDVSSLVLCDPVTILKDERTSAWMTVKVLDVISLPDLLIRFDESSSGEIPLSPAYRVTRSDTGEVAKVPCSHRPHSITRTKHWLLIEWNLEGDIGEWILCRKTASGYSLILYGFWCFDEDYVLAGNRKLSRSETMDLNWHCGKQVFD